jgi:ribosomal protein S18 acetylase RimI-like enzyme
MALAVVTAGCGSAKTGEITGIYAMAYEPSLATFADGLAVAWYDIRDGHGELYEQALDADARPRGEAVRLTTGGLDAYEPDIHAVEGTGSGNGFVIGWYERGNQGTFEPRLGFWSRNGAAHWIKTLAPRGRNTVARVHGDLVFAAWVDDEVGPTAGVWTGWWNLHGETVVAPRRIAEAGKTTYNLNAALSAADGGHGVPLAFVVFDATVRTKAEELYVAEDDGARAQVTRLTPDDGFASTYPDLAFSGSRTALTWFDAKDGNEEVYLSVGTLQALVRPDALTGSRVTYTKGHSIGAYTAWNGERLGLAWCDDTEAQHEIYFAEFDAAGTRRGDVQRLSNTLADSLIPAIHPWRFGFAVAWNEYEGTGGHDGQGRSQVMLKLLP